jgi:phenylacetate-coenzyme A ligase PaaK-like adenylate-forming protein
MPFAMIDDIQGRVEDTLWLPAVNGGRVSVAPLVFNRIMDVLPVSGWQVIHEADDSLSVLLCGANGAVTSDALKGRLAQALSEHGASVPHITIRQVSTIPKTSAGKAPLVKSHWPPA